MKSIELIITSSVNDRMEAAKILVRNGYRVCVVTRKIGSARKPVLVIDKPEGTEEA